MPKLQPTKQREPEPFDPATEQMGREVLGDKAFEELAESERPASSRLPPGYIAGAETTVPYGDQEFALVDHQGHLTAEQVTDFLARGGEALPLACRLGHLKL